ncbi:LptA/OstA family protein [Brucella pituitosa]|uniref:LptA/OstA family protein n=1 Tax=Brucella pituitosa TaxID=571256 RepID=UPI003C75BADF
MHIGKILTICLVSAFASISGANAENTKGIDTPLKIESDTSKSITKTTMQFDGNVSIKVGNTEIKTDKAKVVSSKKKVTIYIDGMVVTVNK